MVSRPAWAQAAHGRSSAEVGMELLIERLAVPNLWLQPVISSQYVHNLPVWKHRGPCRVDSDVGSDWESSGGTVAPTDDRDSRSDDRPSPGSPDSSDASWPAWFGQRRPLMFVCESCRASQSTVPQRSDKNWNKNAWNRSWLAPNTSRMGTTDACVAWVVAINDQVPDPGGDQTGPHHCSRTQSKHPVNQKSERRQSSGSEDFVCLPAGIITMTECSICVESYKYGVVLCGLPCGHSFHQQCIMGWLSRDNHCCPICRWPA